jgi:peptidyl-dipeptidase Dcp
MTNPLLNDLPVPAYDKITHEHFLPALAQRLAEARAKIDTLRADTSAPSLANSAVALEQIFDAPRAVMVTLSTFHNSVNSDELRDVYEQAQKIYDSFTKDVMQDPVLAARVKAVHDARASLNLDEEDERFLHGYYKEFEGSGAFLPDADKQRIRDIDGRLITLSSEFMNNLGKGAQQQAVHITDPAELTGVPDDVIAGMAENAKAKGKTGWIYIPERLQVDTLLTVAENRDFRRKILTALNAIGTQAPHDNRPVIAEMQGLRQERTALLGGYKHYADWALDGTMAGSLDRAEKTLRDCADALLPAFEADVATIADYAAKNGGPATLEPWDSPFWAARYKKDVFAYDAAALSEYLELNHVMAGLFGHFGKLFGVDISENSSYPVFHPDAKSFDVRNKNDGSLAGVLMVDYFARPGTKEGGAWMEHMQLRDDKAGKLNVISSNMNCTQPQPGQPTLLDTDIVTTLYHEKGHAFHGLLGTKTKYKSAQGPGISSDFLEIHSMTQENWAFEREVLKTYAKHYKTGAPVPDALIDAKEKSANFFATRDLLVIIQNALRDLEFHKRDPKTYGSDKAVEASAALRSPHAAHIRPYPLTRFGHLFSAPVGGYAAGYYGYFWANLHAAALFDNFRQKGLYEPALAAKIKAMYEEGSRRDPNQIFEAANGGPAKPDALLRSVGIDPGKKPSAPEHPAPKI